MPGRASILASSRVPGGSARRSPRRNADCRSREWLARHLAKHRPHVAPLGPRPRGRSLRRALLGSYFRPIVRSRERASFSPCTPFGSCSAPRLSGGVSSRGCCSSPRPCLAFAGCLDVSPSPRGAIRLLARFHRACAERPWAVTEAPVGPSAILCGGVLGEDGATDH